MKHEKGHDTQDMVAHHAAHVEHGPDTLHEIIPQHQGDMANSGSITPFKQENPPHQETGVKQRK